MFLNDDSGVRIRASHSARPALPEELENHGLVPGVVVTDEFIGK